MFFPLETDRIGGWIKRQIDKQKDCQMGTISITAIKQLLDEVEHDIMNYQNRGLCYLPKPKAEADNTDTVLIIHAKTEFNNYCFIIHLHI